MRDFWENGCIWGERLYLRYCGLRHRILPYANIFLQGWRAVAWCFFSASRHTHAPPLLPKLAGMHGFTVAAVAVWLPRALMVRTSRQSCDAYRPFRPRRPPAAAPAKCRPRRPPAAAPATARGSAPRRRSGARLSAVRPSPPRRVRCWRASRSTSKTNGGAACKPQQNDDNNVIKEK